MKYINVSKNFTLKTSAISVLSEREKREGEVTVETKKLLVIN